MNLDYIYWKLKRSDVILDTEVGFEGKNEDDKIRLKKYKRKMNMSAKEKEERLEDAVRQLEENGIKVTNKSLRSLGIGSDSVSPFIKKLTALKKRRKLDDVADSLSVKKKFMLRI